ncbi:MAG: hypothetical protein JSR77_17985 [Planctomycetes bacterium]|nr:hypothetical protein [Planctomycetota bacterium]
MCDCNKSKTQGAASAGVGAPTLQPPDLSSSSGADTAGGNAGSPALPLPGEGANTQSAASPAAGPGDTASLDSAGAATWHSDKRINALWSINQNRNVFAGVAGVGWKKLADANDSSVMALNIIASCARNTQGRVDLREESDGKIHEIYAW